MAGDCGERRANMMAFTSMPSVRGVCATTAAWRGPLDEAVRRAVRDPETAGVEAIAIMFLYADLDARHEVRVREIVAEEPAPEPPASHCRDLCLQYSRLWNDFLLVSRFRSSLPSLRRMILRTSNPPH